MYGHQPPIRLNCFQTFTYELLGYIQTEGCVVELLRGFTVQLFHFSEITHTHTHIYISICVCVCVCLYVHIYILLVMILSALNDEAQ